MNTCIRNHVCPARRRQVRGLAAAIVAALIAPGAAGAAPVWFVRTATHESNYFQAAIGGPIVAHNAYLELLVGGDVIRGKLTEIQPALVVIPEPATCGLPAAALAGLCGHLRRRQRGTRTSVVGLRTWIAAPHPAFGCKVLFYRILCGLTCLAPPQKSPGSGDSIANKGLTSRDPPQTARRLQKPASGLRPL